MNPFRTDPFPAAESPLIPILGEVGRDNLPTFCLVFVSQQRLSAAIKTPSLHHARVPPFDRRSSPLVSAGGGERGKKKKKLVRDG